MRRSKELAVIHLIRMLSPFLGFSMILSRQIRCFWLAGAMICVVFYVPQVVLREQISAGVRSPFRRVAKTQMHAWRPASPCRCFFHHPHGTIFMKVSPHGQIVPQPMRIWSFPGRQDT